MMIKAVLLDMDNTLLVNPDMPFAKAFLERFDQHMQQVLQVEQCSYAFREAIQRMSAIRDGDESNTTLIARTLSEASSRPIEQVQHALDLFYIEQYPALQGFISPIAGATELIQHLADEGYTIVIATNPIYPLAAIKQRMQWANLPTDEKLYALITHSDNMHFAKPNPAYFAEILARIGVEPDEAITIGDSLRSDITPSQTIGIHTYHHQEDNLQDFSSKFDSIIENVRPQTLNSDMIEPQLRGNIGALFGLLDGIESGFWHKHPDPDEWSIIQILCHLVQTEDTHERPRLQQILQEDNPFITAPKPPGMQVEMCADEGFSVAHNFKISRLKTIEFLRTLQENDWSRPARHSIFGLTTLLEMAYFTAQHDRLHLHQLCETIGKCRA
jgi:HAD superfamily hydrolase (TIGR01549 family)